MQSDVTGVFLDTDEFADVVRVCAPQIDSFDWTCVLTAAHGLEIKDSNGDTVIVYRREAHGSAADLTAAGITKLRRDLAVTIDGESYGIEINESQWDEYFVRLSLIMVKTARRQEMESRGPVR